MWVEKQIDNLIEILNSMEYDKIQIKSTGDVAIKITLKSPKFKYIKSQRQIKFYNSKEIVIINVWASSNIIIDNKNLEYTIILECDESVLLKIN